MRISDWSSDVCSSDLAVSGFRSGSIEAEMASARLTLLSAGVHFDQRCTLPPLSPQVESALSLSLREAITNVIRHANANAVEVDCETTADGGVQLTVSDDGRDRKSTRLNSSH